MQDGSGWSFTMWRTVGRARRPWNGPSTSAAGSGCTTGSFSVRRQTSSGSPRWKGVCSTRHRLQLLLYRESGRERDAAQSRRAPKTRREEAMEEPGGAGVIGAVHSDHCPCVLGPLCEVVALCGTRVIPGNTITIEARSPQRRGDRSRIERPWERGLQSASHVQRVVAREDADSSPCSDLFRARRARAQNDLCVRRRCQGREGLCRVAAWGGGSSVRDVARVGAG